MSSNSGQSFTVVNLPESPASAASQRNITGLPRTVRDAAADIFNNIQKWNDLHIKGAAIVKEIALLKSDNELYPEGLENLSCSLAEIVNSQQIIINNLEKITKQLAVIIDLHKSVVPLFISWPTEKIAQVTQNIFEAYKKEFEVKEFIAENICHIQGKNKLMFYAVSWAYQPFITSDVKLQLESFLTETGHRSKT